MSCVSRVTLSADAAAAGAVALVAAVLDAVAAVAVQAAVVLDRNVHEVGNSGPAQMGCMRLP